MDAYVVDARSLHLLRLVLQDEASDESAGAEFELEAHTREAAGLDPEPIYNAAGPNGVRARPRMPVLVE